MNFLSYWLCFSFPFLEFCYICWRVEPSHVLGIASTSASASASIGLRFRILKSVTLLHGVCLPLSACIWIDFFSFLFQPLNFLICIFTVVSCYSLQSLIFSLSFFCLFPLANWFYFNMDMQCNLAYGLNVCMLSIYWACMCGVIREERNLLIPIILVRSLPVPCILFRFALSHSLPSLIVHSSRVHLQLRSLLDGWNWGSRGKKREIHSKVQGVGSNNTNPSGNIDLD